MLSVEWSICHDEQVAYRPFIKHRWVDKMVVRYGYPLPYKIRESKLFPKLFSRFLCVFKIK